MDQLKVFLGIVKRQHFWFIAPILFAVGIFGWMSSTKKLNAEFAANSGTVNGYLSSMQGVIGTTPHPNEETEREMEKLISDRRENIKAAWEMKYERQKKQLAWPEDLPQEFRDIVEPLRPIETSNANVIRAPLRRAYANFLKAELPKLAAKIGADWQPTRGGRRGAFSGGDDGGLEEESTAIVVWNPRDQGSLVEKYDWGDSVPEGAEVLYAQEDLWVLDTLIEIIRRTNGDAITRSQAAVKAIEFIQVGADVDPPNSQNVGFKVQGLPEFTEDDGEEADGEEQEEEVAEEVVFGEDFIANADGNAPVVIKDYVKNRYYDANYVPIESREALLTSASVAKRIPVRIRVSMDQRRISELLVECANAALTFEVRQLRYNPKSGGRTRGYGSAEPAFGGGRQKAVAKFLDDYESFDRTVELFGIVYIFNPPNMEMLGGGEDGESEDE